MGCLGLKRWRSSPEVSNMYDGPKTKAKETQPMLKQGAPSGQPFSCWFQSSWGFIHCLAQLQGHSAPHSPALWPAAKTAVLRLSLGQNGPGRPLRDHCRRGVTADLLWDPAGGVLCTPKILHLPEKLAASTVKTTGGFVEEFSEP